MAKSKVWFGDTPVEEQEKTRRVEGVFNQVAQYYDLMNDVMSLGMHRLWKKEFVRSVRARGGDVILDLAGGTGDIARALHRQGARVTICDLSENMVRTGRDKSFDRGTAQGIDYTVGNGEVLPFRDNHFDHVTIAFGLRNVTRVDIALEEIYRVLKPGGKFRCLEFSHVEQPALAKIYDFYSRTLIPRFGALVANDQGSYDYLIESIRRFPDQETLVRKIETAGFRRAAYRNLTGGIVAIHSGLKA